MGGAASIDSAQMNLDFDALTSTSVDFSAAYTALQSKLKKGKSEIMNGDVSIPFLAILQLSQNLRNQDSLERTKKKVLKSRSMPDTLKYKSNNIDGSVAEYEEVFEHADDLDHQDLDLIHDHEYGVSNDRHKPFSQSNVDERATDAEGTPPVLEKPNRKKPNLFLQMSSSKSIGAEDEPLAELALPPSGKVSQKPPSPTANARVSPRGTLYVGKFKVMETGIFPDNGSSRHLANQASASNMNSASMGSSRFESIKRNYIQDHGYVSEKNANGSYLWRVHRNDSGLIVTTSPEDSQSPLLPALGGKEDFVEISTLGSGASGVVTEAIHVPSLTLVALKILPIYNQEKRQHVSRELAVLFRNLTEMRLIDDRLDTEEMQSSRGESGKRCPNVLSLYNAFIDPRSGMINLVVEYMDGGSLEDLVRQGGCRDEQVIADIAYQTLNGLLFLHKNKSVHRDIKPANILCSSQGMVKIADFGISKALDKSTGFANTFVGTVCYMSPERITGEEYSFPCDIWSLGLTLLAVARGRFPLSLKDSAVDGEEEGGGGENMDSLGMRTEDSSPKPIGGAGGYWAMIKAICDHDPPTAGPTFSTSFNEFIDCCLKKEPTERSSARELMQTDFVLSSVSPGKYNWRPEEVEEVEAEIETGKVSGRFSAKDKEPQGELSTQSPLTARLTSVTIAKTAPKDSSPFHLPVAHISAPGGEEMLEAVADDKNAVIYAIRFEHLERVLEKLKTKLKAPKDSYAVSRSEEKEEKGRGVYARGQKEESISESPTCSLDNMLQLPLAQGKPFRSKQVNFPQAPEEKMNARSVHFQAEGDKDGAVEDLLKLRMSSKEEEVDNGDSNCTDKVGKLPKPSSYFLSSQSKDRVQPGIDLRSSKVGHVDYAAMIPKFDKKGLQKWRTLALQLHLPLPLVLLAVRSTLGHVLDLDEVSLDIVEETPS